MSQTRPIRLKRLKRIAAGDFSTAPDCQDAIRTLEAACKLYCRWFDQGQPPMDGGTMAYELVSSIRVALAKLKGDDGPETDG